MLTNNWRENNEKWRGHGHTWRESHVLGGNRIAIDLRRSGIEKVFGERNNVGTSSQNIYGQSVAAGTTTFFDSNCT